MVTAERRVEEEEKSWFWREEKSLLRDSGKEE